MIIKELIEILETLDEEDEVFIIGNQLCIMGKELKEAKDEPQADNERRIKLH